MELPEDFDISSFTEDERIVLCEVPSVLKLASNVKEFKTMAAEAMRVRIETDYIGPKVAEVFNRKDGKNYALGNDGRYKEISLPEEKLNDPVNSPEHYLFRQQDCDEMIKGFLKDMSIFNILMPSLYEGYLEGQIIKYLYRYPAKDGVKDLRKAQHFLEKLIKELDE